MVQISGRFAKFLYLAIMSATVVVAILSKYVYADKYDWWSFDDCGGSEPCQGNQAIYRYSFALAVWFALIAVAVRGHVDVHFRHWAGKFLVYAGLVIAALFIPGSFFRGYAEFARVVSIVFLLLQIFIIIDSAYRLHEYLLTPTIPTESRMAAENGEKNPETNPALWQIIYLAICALFIFVSIAGITLMYVFYDCGLAQFFITFTLVLSVCITLYSVLDSVGIGLMVPSVVTAYCVFLCWQSLHSMPSESCNPQADAPNNIGMLVIGLVIACISLVYTAAATSNGVARLFHQQEKDKTARDPNEVYIHEPKKGTAGGSSSTLSKDSETETGELGKRGKDDHAIEINQSKRDDVSRNDEAEINVNSSKKDATDATDATGAATGTEPVRTTGGRTAALAAALEEENSERANTELNRKNHWRFHWLMAMGAVYGAMLLTNWGSTRGGDQAANTDVSLESMWVKIISQWLTFGMYIWTIIAPRVCPDRDFTV